MQKKHSMKRMSDRHLRSASQFFKFSPTRLRLSLLPRWVFLSLVINAFLGTALFAFVLRQVRFPTLSASASTDPIATATPITPLSDPISNDDNLSNSPRHQLSYQQWVEQLTQEADVVAEQKPSKLTVLAGDSISLWFPIHLLPPNRHWLNQGISGETSAGLLKRIHLFSATTPETVYVLVGINDLIRGVDDRTILDNQEQIIRDLKIDHPKSQIVLQSILPHAGQEATWEGRDRLLAVPNRRIQNLNRQLESIARQEGIYFLDLYPLFSDAEGTLRMEYSTDGLHLNTKGYEVWSVALQVYMNEVLKPDLEQG